jgi:anti-sigma B factor antagonist
MGHETVRVNIETYSSIPNLKVITIEGKFDTVTTKQVDEKILPVMEREKSNVVIDMSKLDYLSSIGILRLIQYISFMKDEKRVLKFVKPPEHIYSTLLVAGVLEKFDMYDSLVEAAISSFR